MISPSQSHRRRALYTGLKSHLPPADVLAALNLYEIRYASEPQFAVRYFVADIAKNINNKVPPRALLNDLLASLAKPTEQLLPDPDTALAAYRANPAAMPLQRFIIPELHAFQLLITKWLARIDPMVANDVVVYVARHLYELKIETTLKSKIANWLAKMDSDLTMVEVKTQDLRAVVNLFYVAFCTFVGPMHADATLAEAVTTLRNNGGAVYSQLFGKLL